VQRQQRWFSAEELHARVVMNCSEFFRNVTVLDRRVMARGRADPHRLNERDHGCQVRYRYTTGAVQRKKDVAFQIPVNISTNRQSMLRRN
jgi:hypothetical protein